MRRVLIAILLVPCLATIAQAQYRDDSASYAALHSLASAQHQVSAAIVSLQRDFEQSSDYTNARSAVRTALGNYHEACAMALMNLHGSVEFKRLDERISELQRKQTWGLFDDHMTPAQLSTIAQALLDARSKRSAMESAPLAKDAEVIATKTALIDANGRLLAVLRDFEQSIANSSQFVSAKQNLDAVHAQISPRH